MHIAEIDSFLLAHRLWDKSLDQAGRDGYVADTARVATALGVLDPPHRGRTSPAPRDFRRVDEHPGGPRGSTVPAAHAPLPLLARAL